MSFQFKLKRALRRRVLRRLEPCSTMVPLISESLDRRLGVIDLMKVKLHLLVCAWCNRYLKQIRMIRELLRLNDDSLDFSTETLGAEARERITRDLEKVRDEIQ